MHPLIKIILFIAVLVLASALSGMAYAFLGACVYSLAVVYYPKMWLESIKRMRWFFITMLMIYAFATPGELVPYFPIQLAPTYEGIQFGLMQISKLLLALAALALLLGSTTQKALILGLYLLFKPLQLLGLNTNQFAARLYLTLEYVEQFAEQRHTSDKAGFSQVHLRDWLQHVMHPSLFLPNQLEATQMEYIAFDEIPFTFLDKCLIILMMVSMMTMLVLR